MGVLLASVGLALIVWALSARSVEGGGFRIGTPRDHEGVRYVAGAVVGLILLYAGIKIALSN